MPKQDSPLGQLEDVIPEDLDTPDVNGDMAIMIAAIERRLLQSYPDRATRAVKITSPINGMRTYIENVGEIDERIAGQWVKVWPTIYSGTNVPGNGLGAPNDLYIQYTA